MLHVLALYLFMRSSILAITINTSSGITLHRKTPANWLNVDQEQIKKGSQMTTP